MECTYNGSKSEVFMAIHEACAVWIEQRIDEELKSMSENGETHREISRKLVKEIEKVFETKMKPETIRTRMRRMAGSNDPPKKNNTKTVSKAKTNKTRKELLNWEKRLIDKESELNKRDGEIIKRAQDLRKKEAIIHKWIEERVAQEVKKLAEKEEMLVKINQYTENMFIEKCVDRFGDGLENNMSLDKLLKSAYRQLIKMIHTDHGGDHLETCELNNLRDDLKKAGIMS